LGPGVQQLPERSGEGDKIYDSKFEVIMTSIRLVGS